MEKRSPPIMPATKFNFFYFLPKSVHTSPLTTPSPRPKKKKKTTTAPAAIVRRSTSVRRVVKIKRSITFKEPRSPKVSCIGNVASKGNNKKNKERERKRTRTSMRRNDRKGKENRNTALASRSNTSLILKLLEVFKKKGTETANRYAEPSHSPAAAGAVYERSAPKSGRVKKFFDWRARGSSAVASHRLPLSSFSKKRQEKRTDGTVVVVENIVLVPRKEINLWKKRMVSPPPPLVV